MTHASGRPVMALMLAEEHGNGELYREASRFVLDQRGSIHITKGRRNIADVIRSNMDIRGIGYADRGDAAEAVKEVSCLPGTARFRADMEIRRNWFLERLLKLGSIDVKKEYTCVSFPSVKPASLASRNILMFGLAQRPDCP